MGIFSKKSAPIVTQQADEVDHLARGLVIAENAVKTFVTINAQLDASTDHLEHARADSHDEIAALQAEIAAEQDRVTEAEAALKHNTTIKAKVAGFIAG